MCCLSHWSRQHQHLLQWLQALGAQELQWAQTPDRGPWLQVYTVPGNCPAPIRQTTDGSLSRTWQAGGGTFLLLSRRHALSRWWLWTFNHNTSENGLEEVQGAATSSLFPPLKAACTALVCGAQCSMPVRLGPWQSRNFNAYSGMIGQWSDRSAMSSHKTLLPLGHMGCVHSLASKIWTSSWRRKDSSGMDTFNDQKVPSSQPVTYRLNLTGGLGGLRWHGNSWQGSQKVEALCYWPHDRDTWRSGVRSALCAGRQQPGRRPTDVDIVPEPVH